MKILHVIRGMANSSGTTHIVGPLAEAQARQGAEVVVYCVAKGAEPAVLPDRDLVASRCFALTLPFNNPGVSVALARALRDRIRRFDVMHVHAIWNFPSWWAMRTARRAGVPYVVAPQGSLEPWALNQNRLGKQVYGALTEMPLLRAANCMQALTETEADQCRRFGIDAPSSIIPNGIDEAVLRHDWQADATAFGLADECRTLLFLSRIHPKKGLDLLLEAFGQLAVKFPEWRLVVAGDDAGLGYLKAFESACARTGLTDKVVLLGEVRDEWKWQVLSSVDVFVLPSRSEGLPVAVLEALGSAVPVVITSACNVPEVEEWGAGLVAAPTMAALTESLQELFSSSTERRRDMGRNARRLAAAKFTWPRIAAQTLDCYREVGTRSRGGSPSQNVRGRS